MNPADIHSCSYQCERPSCIRRQRDELYLAIMRQEPGFTAADMADQYATAFERGRESVLANPCRCIDCGGVELAHSDDCTNMAELHGTPAAPRIDLRERIAVMLRSEFDMETADPEDPRCDDGHVEALRIADKIVALIDASPKGERVSNSDELAFAAAQEAVAWTVVGPDGKSSIGGWQDMKTHDFWKEAGVLREGHRYAYAYAAPVAAAPRIDLRRFIPMLDRAEATAPSFAVRKEIAELRALIDASPKAGDAEVQP